MSECQGKDLRAFVAYRVATVPRMRLVPATSSLKWVDTTSERFAHRCLPLLIANQNGWVILNSHRFRATWNGEPSPNSLEVECLTGTAPYPATSHLDMASSRGPFRICPDAAWLQPLSEGAGRLAQGWRLPARGDRRNGLGGGDLHHELAADATRVGSHIRRR